ncbi:MAG TPA: FAD binding domain-containing protein [Acidimicrobiales bacterium]|nr:FAD binding domain-containing protein [Acidimicrobiales bacterium]
MTAGLRPSTWAEALALKTAHPDAVAINGGTDLMVEINFARHRPPVLLDLTHVAELRHWEVLEAAEGGRPIVRLGAGVTYTAIVDDVAELAPGLAMAARTVGSPQIRNRGTIGGNLGTASPAGDAHPPLLAARAVVEVERATGRRLVPIDEFFTGPKRNVLAPDELIRAVRIPVADGPQQFSKVGPRNAMVIATTSFALCVDRSGRRIGTGIGSAGPTPLRATEAEAFAGEAMDGRWDAPGPLAPDVADRFGELVAAAASPIDDVRGEARYRRHALAVLARRCLGWVWSSLDGAGR